MSDEETQAEKGQRISNPTNMCALVNLEISCCKTPRTAGENVTVLKQYI